MRTDGTEHVCANVGDRHGCSIPGRFTPMKAGFLSFQQICFSHGFGDGRGGFTGIETRCAQTTKVGADRNKDRR